MKPHLAMALLAFAVAAYAFYLAFARKADFDSYPSDVSQGASADGRAEDPPAAWDMLSVDEPCTCFAAVTGEEGNEHLRMSYPPRWLSEDESQWCYVIGRGMDNDVFAICSPGVIGLLPPMAKAQKSRP